MRKSKTGYGIRFMTEDSSGKYPVYFERYVDAREGCCDIAILMDGVIYAKSFGSKASATRMLNKIRRRVKEGRCACVRLVDDGEVFMKTR